MATNAFRRSGATQTVSASVANATTAIQANAQVLRVTNFSSVVIFISFGNSAAQAATAADIPVLQNTQVDLDKGGATYCGILAASGTAVVYITPGEL